MVLLFTLTEEAVVESSSIKTRYTVAKRFSIRRKANIRVRKKVELNTSFEFFATLPRYVYLGSIGSS